MSDFASHLAALEHALQAATPPTEAAIAHDAYPNLKVERAPAATSKVDDVARAALEASGWPEWDQQIPLPAELSGDQRALADVLAQHVGVSLHRFAIPQTQRARRLWLGLEDAGPLAREVGYKIDDESFTAPLWRALRHIDRDGNGDDAEALFQALPLGDQIEAYGELAFGGFRVDPPCEIVDPGDKAGEWAAAYADRLLALFAEGAPHHERGNNHRPPRQLLALVFKALDKAGIAIDARWDCLVPFDLDLIEPLPPERQTPILVRGLQAEFPSWAIKKGREVLRRFPSAPVLEHLLERADQCISSLSCPPRGDFLVDLRQLVADDPELIALIDAHEAELPLVTPLVCTRKLYPKSVDELTEGQKSQLAILGQGWETDDGPMVFKNDEGETEFGELAFVSAYEIADADGNPAFEALLYMDEDGAVCRAGTTNSVMYVCQMRLEWNIDLGTVEALQAILRERP